MADPQYTALLQQMQQLTDAMRNSVGGSMSGGTESNRYSRDPSATREEQAVNARVEKTMKDTSEAVKEFSKLSKNQSKTTEDMAVQMKLSSRLMQDAISNADLDKLATIPNVVKKALEESNSSYAQQQSANIASLGDVLKIEDQISAQRELIKNIEDLKGGALDLDAWADLTFKAKQQGIILDDNMMHVDANSKVIVENTDDIENLSKMQEELTERTEDLSDCMVKATRSINKSSGGFIKGLTGKLGMIGKIIGALIAPATMFIKEQRAAMKYGLADNIFKVAEAALQLGLAVPEMKEIQAANRQISYAMGGMDQFQSMWAKTSDALFPVVGDLQDASRIAVQFSKNLSNTGIAASELEEATLSQVKIYEDHYRKMGMSAEQFGQFTQDLIEDTEFRHSMARLKKEERRGYMESVQLRMAENTEMGYTLERTKELQKYFARISGQDTPMERMKKAARMGSMLGALGMGREGQELNDLMRRLPTMQEGERSNAEQRITEINEKAANLYFEKLGGSMAENATFQTLGMQTGFHEVASQFETASVEARKYEQELADREYNATRDVHSAIVKGVKVLDKVEARMNNSVALLAAIAGAGLGGKLAGKVMHSLGAGNKNSAFGSIVGGVGAVLGFDEIMNVENRAAFTPKNDIYRDKGITRPEDMAAVAKRQNELQAEGIELQKAQTQALNEIATKIGATTKAVTEQGEKASEYEEDKKRNKTRILVPSPGWVSPPP